MPPPSPPRAGSPPPPPTADAPRPADLAKSGNTPTAADKTSGGDHAAAVPASPSSAAPVPAGSTKKDVTANAAAVDAVVDGVATLSVDGGDGQAAVESRVVGGGDGGASSGVAPAEKPAAASKFGSPGRHRAPTAKSELPDEQAVSGAACFWVGVFDKGCWGHGALWRCVVVWNRGAVLCGLIELELKPQHRGKAGCRAQFAETRAKKAAHFVLYH